MRIADYEFKFGIVESVYSDETKATVRLKNVSKPLHFYRYQKEKALKLNIGTKIAVAQKKGFNNIIRLNWYKELSTEDGSGKVFAWYGVVVAAFNGFILTSLGTRAGKKFVYVKTSEAYKPKDTFMLVLKDNNMPQKHNGAYSVVPDNMIKVNLQ